ncbi:hypothetical protein CHARACLAT_001058 [Characodon lateralis]|uniref:Uncharacterized protein n=1 Tax=Characodon lateralis TaxID=208331 RepID=A0ABU7EGS4_9TELE|nr:hypothetical protein [Characodon lateralis]
MIVTVCACFFVSGWVLGCSLSWISLGSPSNVGPISSPPHYLPVVGVFACQCTCGSRCPGLGALVCTGSLPVAACRSLDPWALSGLCLGSDMSLGLGSLGPWLDLLGRRWLPAVPMGSPLQLPGAAALWLLGGSLATLLCSSLGGLVPAVVLVGFLCSGGPLDVCGSDLLRICPGSRGAGLWLLTLATANFYGQTLCTQARSHSDPQVFRFRC